MAKKLQTAIKAGVLLVLAAVLFVYANCVFSIKQSADASDMFNAYYAEPEGTIDVAYLGNCATNRYFVNPQLFHEEGITCFSLAPAGSPLFLLADLIDEVERTQDPEVYVLEIRGVRNSQEDTSDGNIRNTMDNVEYLSPAHFSMMEHVSEQTSNPISDYLFPITRYHDRLITGDLTTDDLLLKRKKNETKGYQLSTLSRLQQAQLPGDYSRSSASLDQDEVDVMLELLDKCDELRKRGKKILFVIAPFCTDKELSRTYNAASALVSNRGYDIINFNSDEMVEELGLDWEVDFSDAEHVNYSGAEKYTRYLGNYLKKSYELEDHRGDSAYASWETAYETYQAYIADGKVIMEPTEEVAAAYKESDVDGWVIKDDKLYYFEEGIRVRDKKVDGITLLSDGSAKDDTATQFKMLVMKKLDELTTEDMSREEKLRICFSYCINMEFAPSSRPDNVTEAGWLQKCAVKALTTHEANCEGMATSFAGFALELGYEPTVRIAHLEHAYVIIDGRAYDNMADQGGYGGSVYEIAGSNDWKLLNWSETDPYSLEEGASDEAAVTSKSKKGWNKSKTVYRTKEGKRVKGVACIGGKAYYFNEKGKLDKEATKNLRAAMVSEGEMDPILEIAGEPDEIVTSQMCDGTENVAYEYAYQYGSFFAIDHQDGRGPRFDRFVK